MIYLLLVWLCLLGVDFGLVCCFLVFRFAGLRCVGVRCWLILLSVGSIAS